MPLSTPADQTVTPKWAGAVALVAVLVWVRALANGYAFDDVAIAAHPALRSWRTLPHALDTAWWADKGRLYRPLTLFTLGLEHLVAGGAPWLPHAVNVLLHATVAALVVRLGARFLSSGAALVAGLCFAMLPVHAEAVASVVGRAELLCAVFVVGLLLLVTRQAPPTRPARLLALCLAGAALASKEGGAVAPVLALAAAWTLPAQRRHALRWAGASMAGTAIVLIARGAALGTLGGDVAHPAFRGAGAMVRLPLALAMLPRSAAMLALPVPPAIDFAPPLSMVEHPPLLLVMAGAALVAVALVALARHRRAPSALTLGIIVASGLLLPTANLLFGTGVVSSGRTLYGPSVGSALLAGVLAERLSLTRARRRWAAAGAVSLLIGAALSWREAAVWHDTPRVLATIAARQPDDYRPEAVRGYALRDSARWRESLPHFRRAVALFPADPELVTDAATVALHVGDTVTGERWLWVAVGSGRQSARARTRLAALLRARGDTAGWRRLLEEGLRADPSQRTWARALAEAR